MDDTLERIYDLSYNGIFEEIDSFLTGSTGELDEYIYKEKADELRFEDDQMTLICEASLEMAREYIDYIKNIGSTLDVTETELLLYSAWKISTLIKKEIDKVHASYQGDEYSSREEYGSKSNAFDKGYDDYMANNASSGYTYLSEIINIYNNTMSK